MTNINQELQKLANINEDACEFYEEAQKKTKSSGLEITFNNLENLHKSVVLNIHSYLRTNNQEPDTTETFEGEIREFWGKLMASISNDVDETLITHLEEAEDRCLHQIEDIMNNKDTPPVIKVLLEEEYEILQKSHDYMKDLKETVKAA